MVLYKCEICNKQFTKKSHYLFHTIKKKKPCEDKKELKTLSETESYNTENYNIENYNIENYSESCKSDNDEIENKNCILCGKKFSRLSSLKRHILERCNKNKDEKMMKAIMTQQEQIDNLTKIINSLKEEKSKCLTLINSGTNGMIKQNIFDINTNTNINNQVNNVSTNIKIEFGKEDLSKISNEFFIKTLLNSTGALIPSKIIEGIHFNPEYAEFMNVFISDFSRNKAMIYDGKNWNIANADEIVNTLFDKAIIFCEDRNEELYEKIQKNEKIKKKINKEMYVMQIMTNNEPYEYNEYKEPIDVNGNVLVLSEMKRGKSLNSKAKEHLKNSLYNKKTLVIK
jgi:hypothetical protein